MAECGSPTNSFRAMSDIFRFEDFELDRSAYELRRAGQIVHLERIPLDVLCLLTARCGNLVTRQEILDQVWGRPVVGDADNGINTAVRKIRQALEDNPDNPQYLFTVPGKGYRFAKPPTPLIAIDSSTLVESAATAPPRPFASPSGTASGGAPGRSRWWLAAVAVFILVGAILLATSHRPTRGVASTGPAMLAVLPFVNMSGDPQQDYFADGMTEEVIAQLGGLDPAHLRVIARTTVMQYKGAHKNVGQIAGELGVNYILEGSVRNDAGRVRVTGQLIQASDQTHLWAGSYDGVLSDILRLQTSVANGIANKIRLTLTPQAQGRVASAPLLNADAHEAYLRGLQAFNLRTSEGISRSISEFTRSITIDGSYAPSYAALARAYSLAPIFSDGQPSETMPKARSAAERALQLDDSLAEAHATLAFVKAHYEFDWPAAQIEFRRALELNPSDAQTHLFYSNSYLSPFRRHDEAIAEIRTAVKLDPLSMPIQAFVGRTYLWARRYKEALAEFQRADQMSPNVALVAERVAHLFTYTGDYDKAIAAGTRARVLSGESAQDALAKGNELRDALASQGPKGYWQVMLRLSESPTNPPEAYDTSYGRAIILSRLGERDKAVAELEKAYAERQLAMTEIGIEPAFDGLRANAQFTDLVRRIGLSQ
jgi:TolB-like protein/DNA-binding winged helix-turn-helix (wHTH) protein/Tfp pilus assembly protein PilF